MAASKLLLPLPRAAPLAFARPRSSGIASSSSSIERPSFSLRQSERLDANRRRSRRRRQSNHHLAFASAPSNRNEGDEVVQETLAEMIRLQVGAEEVKEFVEKESDKLRESAEKVKGR